MRLALVCVTAFALAACRGPSSDAVALGDVALPLGEVALALPPAAEPTPSPCGGCHPEEVSKLSRSSKGRSFSVANAPASPETYPSGDVTHAESGLVYRAFVLPDGRRMQEERRVDGTGIRQLEARFAIGSGQHLRSFLGVSEAQGGGLVELPLSFDTPSRRWVLTPGFAGLPNPRFERRVGSDCLFCHNDLTPRREETVNVYDGELAVGLSCVRCHGDAEAHLTAKGAIYNPGKDTPNRQLQVCQQCHLRGEVSVLATGRTWEAYGPNEPLTDFMSTYRTPTSFASGFASTGHPSPTRPLEAGPCLPGQQATVPCTTCHDPHLPESILKTSASLPPPSAESGPRAAESGPRAVAEPPTTLPSLRALVAGAASADSSDERQRRALAQLLLAASKADLAPDLLHALRALQLERGDALVALGRLEARHSQHESALTAFAGARARGVRDPMLADDEAESLRAIGQLESAVRVLSEKVKLAPDGERLLRLGRLALFAEQKPLALPALEQAHVLLKHRADPALTLAAVAKQEGRLPAAIRLVQSALDREPNHIGARLMAAQLAAAAGSLDAAVTQGEWALRLAPNNVPGLLLMAALSEQRREFVKAIDYVERASRLIPEDKKLKGEVSRLRGLEVSPPPPPPSSSAPAQP